MEKPVIIEAVRTAIGRLGGTLGNELVDNLAANTIKEVITRVNKEIKIDEVILGQAKQSADSANLARLAALRAGLPEKVTGYTIQRQCGSGLQSINNAQMQIQLGVSDVVIAGGAESMSTAPYYIRNARFGYKSGNGLLLDPNTESQPRSQPIEIYGDITMGLTAEYVAEKYNISREEQDEFALRSQMLAKKAIENGRFEDEIFSYQVKMKKDLMQFKVDEHPRNTSLNKMKALNPVFKKGGTVTAGNSSGRNDAASVLLMMSSKKAIDYSLEPRAQIISHAVTGVSPKYMGIGPVSSTKLALKKANLDLKDIDLIELNEAFAAQALAVIKILNLDLNKVNVNGGAIALGHPLGATGSILMTKLINELEKRNLRYGLVTLCIGGGQGISTIIENLNYIN